MVLWQNQPGMRRLLTRLPRHYLPDAQAVPAVAYLRDDIAVTVTEHDNVEEGMERHGFAPVGYYYDYVSDDAPLLQRPGLTKLLTDLQVNNIHTVFVERLERLSSKLIISEALIAYLAVRDIKVLDYKGKNLTNAETELQYAFRLFAFELHALEQWQPVQPRPQDISACRRACRKRYGATFGG